MNCQNCSRETVQQAKFCNYCGARVAVVCPSCQTFNAADSLFCSDCGSALTQGDAAPGEPAPESSERTPPRPVSRGCPRCGAANEPGSVYCFQCGLPLDEEPHPGYAVSAESTHAYRSPRARAIWTLVLLVVTGITAATNMFMTAEVLDLRQRYEAGAFLLLSQLAEAEENRDAMLVFYGLVRVATAIAFLFWIFHVSRNLRSLGASGQRFSPGWAVGWWFIPFMFFFRPYQVMAEIWRGSAPRASGGATFDWKTESVSALLAWWWASWIVYAFGGEIVDDFGGIIGQLQIRLLVDTLGICAVVLAMVVVTRTTNRQDGKNKKIISESSWSL